MMTSEVGTGTESITMRDDEEVLKADRRFVGLANQGATCYMNSLLQTLFMTPEFRRHLYMWRFSEQRHGNKEDCIPFQLQLLFSKLQLSQSYYAETTGLTKSFQWDTRDSFQQHDVQEFCRVLFDAIEQSVKFTEQERMISELFEGTMVDYVRCENCGTESQREDKYMDVSLAVLNPFENIYNDSVEKALDNFVSVEHLTGENQYFCEHCQSKQDARKGLKFKSFPPIFMLQLKRFDLDYETLQRIKINDKVTFPQILNLNPYVNLAKPEYIMPPANPKETTKAEEVEEPDIDIRPAGFDTMDLNYYSTSFSEYIDPDYISQPIQMDHLAKKVHIDRKSAESRLNRHKDIERFKQEGENVYELFSILIHSGSALGGHYYSYIKAFAHDRWYIFNDSSVYEIEETELEKAFGGEETKLWGNFTTSACAYLLVYRKVSPSNVNVIEETEVPDYIMDSIMEEKEKEKQEEKEKEEQKRIYSIRVYFQGKEKQINIDKGQTLNDLKTKVVEAFKITTFAWEDLRLRGYSFHKDTYQETYTGHESKTLEQLLIYNYKLMVLETKSPDEKFEDYIILGISLKVVVWEDAIEHMENMTLHQKTVNAKRIQMTRDATLLQFLEKVSQVTSIPVERLRVLRPNFVTGPSSLEVISNPRDYGTTLTALRVYDTAVLYVEDQLEKDQVSKWEGEFEREMYRYVIKFNHPDDTPSFWAQNDFKNSAVIDSRETVAKLKDLIGKVLSLDTSKFILKRGSKQGAEIKELDYKISQSSLFNGGLVYVERGIPSKPDEYRICVSYSLQPRPDAPDWTLYEFTDIVEMPISGNATVENAKEMICQKTNAIYPSMNLKSEYLRLRERNSDRLGRILRESDQLKAYSLFEKKQIAIQEFPTPVTELNFNDIALIMRKFSPATWELSLPQELTLPRYSSFHELGIKASEVFGIPQEFIKAARITNMWNFTRADLSTEQWFLLNNSTNRLSGLPWYLSFDGSFVIVKDGEESLRPMSEDEHNKYSGRTVYTSSTYVTWKYEKPKEEAVKITVKNRAEEQKQEEDQKQEEHPTDSFSV